MKSARVLGLAAVLIVLGATSAQAQPLARIVFAADRAPTVTGEIFRLDPNGHRVDLSNSPYQDTQPVVSPDGRTVAFLSNRSGTYRIYEVGINGRGLRDVTSGLSGLASGGADLTWQPHGDLLTVETTSVESPEGHVWLVPAHGKPTVVSRFDFGLWSPNGRILLTWAGDEIRAVAPDGQSLWTAAANQPAGAWSQQGLLAVPVYHGAAVYDESGRELSKFGFPDSNARFSWSPNGKRLAVLWFDKRYELDVRTPDGRLLLRKTVAGGDMAWAGNSRVVLGIAGCATCKTVGVDIRSGKTSPASSGWLAPRSPDGSRAILTPAHKPGFSLGVAAPGGSGFKTYERIGGCYGDGDWMPAATSLGFVGDTRSIVYQSWNVCDEPYANLYSVEPNGTDIQRLTNVQAQETQPAVYGNEIAYVWAAANGMSCKGCSDGIRVVDSNGKGGRTLTNPQDCTFDDSPTWSPDGTTILYLESTCDTGGELFTVPSAGGTPHDLGIKGDNPAWGPTRIAYNGPNGLTTANPDGSDPHVVSLNGDHPTWSPDGTLAYRLGKYVVVGTTKIRLPFAQVTSLRWSPDGTRFIVIATKLHEPLAPLDVYTVKTDGTDPVRLTKNYGALAEYGR